MWAFQYAGNYSRICVVGLALELPLIYGLAWPSSYGPLKALFLHLTIAMYILSVEKEVTCVSYCLLSCM